MVRQEYSKVHVRSMSQEKRAVYGAGLEDGMARDEYTCFFVSNLTTMQRDRLSVRIQHEQGGYAIPYDIIRVGEDSDCYRISYCRDTPGHYQIEVSTTSVDGKSSLPLTSTRVHVNADFNLVHANLQDHFVHCMDPDKTTVSFNDKTHMFTIQTRNWRGGVIKEGGLMFAADIKFLQDKSNVPFELTDMKNGTYQIQFKPQRSGRYSLDLGLKDIKGKFIRIKGSPYEGALLLDSQAGAPIDPTRTNADWDKFKNHKANDMIKFMIEAVDKKGNIMVKGGTVFDAKMITPSKKEIPIIVVDHEDGSYTGTVNPKVLGVHTIDIRIKDEKGKAQHISGSPHNFYVNAPEFDIDPALTTATGPGLEGGQTGKFTNFVVTPKNSKGQLVPEANNPVSVKITYGSSGKEIPADIRDNADGVYQVRYCPQMHGRYAINVFIVDNKGRKIPIKGSPFTFDIEPGINVPYANTCTAYGMGMVSAKVCQESTFFIQARNKSRQEIPAKVTEFEAYLEDEDEKRLPMSLSENADGTLTAAYTVTKPGIYTGFVLLSQNTDAPQNEEDRIISCAPFMLDVIDKLSPAHSQILGLEKDVSFFVASTTFRIVTKNSNGEELVTGGDSFDVKIEGPKGTVPVGISDNFDGSYDVTFHPNVAGAHTISVLYEGAPLAGSPFVIDVEEAADSAQSSTTKYMFVVQMRTKDGRDKEQGGDFFEVNVTGPDGKVDDVQVTDVGDGSLYVQYVLSKPGEYWVKAVLNYQTLQGFPFLHIVP